MIYPNIQPATFLSRPNRFVAHCVLQDAFTICHVKNTGRCRELLLPGAQVYVQKASNPKRTTQYDLITVVKSSRLVNIDSQIPNRVFAQWAEAGGIENLSFLKPEVTYGHSRLDFYLEAGHRKIFVEVKGVTLEEDGVARFPDAPTERGVKHLHTLCNCVSSGYEAMVVFIIQMKGLHYFTPNDKTHAAFGATLREASRQGVAILALDCHVTPDSIVAGDPVKVVLDEQNR